VLGHELWERLFAVDPDILGTDMVLYGNR
jgi:hypothetical protein